MPRRLHLNPAPASTSAEHRLPGFPQRLRSAIRASGLQAKVVAARAGIRPQRLSELQSGLRTGWKYHEGLAEALGVRVQWLRTGQGGMKSESLGDVSLPPEFVATMASEEAAQAMYSHWYALTQVQSNMAAQLAHDAAVETERAALAQKRKKARRGKAATTSAKDKGEQLLPVGGPSLTGPEPTPLEVAHNALQALLAHEEPAPLCLSHAELGWLAGILVARSQQLGEGHPEAAIVGRMLDRLRVVVGNDLSLHVWRRLLQILLEPLDKPETG